MRLGLSLLALIHLLVQPCLASPELLHLPSITEQLSSHLDHVGPPAALDRDPSPPVLPSPTSTTSPDDHSIPLNHTASLLPSIHDDLDDTDTASYDALLATPTLQAHQIAKRALASGCFYTCPTALTGILAPLAAGGNKFPTCTYSLIGLGAGTGTCTYSSSTGLLVTETNLTDLTGRCPKNAREQCAAGTRSLTKQRQAKKRAEEEEKERRRPSRRLEGGKVPEEMQLRYELWRKGRMGRLGEETGERIGSGGDRMMRD